MVATGENTIYIEFSDEVDEASAENISNYTIDEGVGAPRKAVYDEFDIDGNKKIDNDEKYIVKLTTNDLVNGWNEYDLTVNGVLDLAGNELFHKAKITFGPTWDTTAPELEDGDAVDNRVVALTFDEKVTFNALKGAAPNDAVELILSVNDNTDAKTYANTIRLTAKDIIEDDTVVEFCYDVSDPDKVLPDDVTFSVYKIVYYDGTGTERDGGITDFAGNPVVVADVMAADVSFEGTSETHEFVELDSYSQIDAKTFELVFPRKVVIKNATATTSLGDFDVVYESASVTEDDKIRLIKKVDYIEEDKDYVFNFRNFLEDKLGFAVANDEEDPTATPAVYRTELTGEYDDEDAPYVDDVVARDRKWIKVVFNERIDESTIAPSDFELKNYDLDKQISIDKVEKDTLNDGIIYLRAVKPLEARYEYSLELKGTIKDFRGLAAEKDTFYFDGTNVAPYGAAKWTTP